MLLCLAGFDWFMAKPASHVLVDRGRRTEVQPVLADHGAACHPRTRSLWETAPVNCRRCRGFSRLSRARGKLKSPRADIGWESASRLLDHWAYLSKVELDFSGPRKPTENACVEALNARLRAECLNASRFLSLADARERIKEWRCHYNEERPCFAQSNLTPRAFAA